MKIPEITVQGWHNDGPVYRIHRKLSGWRHRKARRAGDAAFDQIGHPGGRNVEGPASFMAFAHGDVEVYAFNRGHVYDVEQLVDGEARRILIDARSDYALHTFKGGIEFLAAQGLTEEQVAELEAEADELPEPEQPSDVSDGAEDQSALVNDGEPIPVSPSGTIAVADQGGGVPPTAELTDAQVDAIDTAIDEQEDAARDAAHAAAEESSTGQSEGGTSTDADDLTDEELEALTAPGAPSADATGGDEADDEEE